jgi:hypothetical protein
VIFTTLQRDLTVLQFNIYSNQLLQLLRTLDSFGTTPRPTKPCITTVPLGVNLTFTLRRLQALRLTLRRVNSGTERTLLNCTLTMAGNRMPAFPDNSVAQRYAVTVHLTALLEHQALQAELGPQFLSTPQNLVLQPERTLQRVIT